MNLGDDKSTSKSNTVAQKDSVIPLPVNLLSELNGNWSNNACEDIMKINPSSTPSLNYKGTLQTNDEVILSVTTIEKISSFNFQLSIRPPDNSYEDELILIKINNDRFKFDRWIQKRPTFETYILDGKDFEKEQALAHYERCK